MKKRFLFVFIMVIGLVLVACGGDYSELEEETGSDANADSGGENEVIVAIDQNFVTLDPHDASDTVSIFGFKYMYVSFLEFYVEGEIKYYLSEVYEDSEYIFEYNL